MTAKWKPIATAPKDIGTILIRGDGILNAPRVVSWCVVTARTPQWHRITIKKGWYDSKTDEFFTSEATQWAKCSTREKLKKHTIGNIYNLTTNGAK